MGPTGRLVTIRRSGLDGAHFPLSLSTCLFGRGIECDIRIQLPVVSKQHCKIEVRDQKAVLFNFSAANPTQVNGSAIDGPVQLKHGDVITVIDRSFRYENDSHPDGSKSTEFPGQRCEQASPRRVSRSSFSSNPEGKVQDPSAARSQVTEEGGSGGPPERRERVGATRTPSRGSEGPATKGTADAGSLEPPGDHHGNAAGPLAGGFGAGSRVTAASWNGGQDPEKDGEKESPFRKLYESLKEELDVKPEKEAVPQNRRKSGSRGHGASESESATQPPASPKARRRSGRSSQAEAERAGEGLAQAPEATPSPSVPRTEAKTPVPCSQQNSSQRRRSGELSATRGGGPVSVQPREDLGAGRAVSAPRRLSARQQTPTDGTSAGDLGNTAEKVSSRKRRRSLSPAAGVLPTGTDFPKQALPSPLPVPTEQKVPGGALGTPRQQQGAAAAGSPDLSALDVSNVGDALSKTEGKPLKRRRVSFGGHLRPELFDENLPPNTPLKRGETPMKRRSLVAHTPPVLKKIIKEQPSEKGEPSEIRSEVATQNSPTNTSPLTNDARRRSPKPPASSGSKSPHHTDAPERGGRRSSSGPARRASVDRSQRGILQTIHSRRRSGASEANLMVSRSWADVVKLSAKQTQTKVVRHGPPRPGPPRPPSKRQRRVNTPKKPLASVHNEFSTGHAASPCTIVIGRAHIEKVSAPARPYRMLNNFVINKKIDFDEDLSGLTEMFKTPAKEKPQTMKPQTPTTFSNSEDPLGKKFQVLNSEDKPLLCTPGKFGEKDLNAPEELWDKQSSSPAFTQQYVTVNGNMKTPRLETELPKAASSTNKSRRSLELRNIQVTGAECGKDDKEVNTVQNILGRCLRKSSVQTQLPEGEMKERERSFGTCNKNNEPRENFAKPNTGRRSRRSSELRCTPRAGLIPIQTLQETESKEDLEGSHSFLQNPSRAEEPVGMETKTTLMHCKSPAPVSTPTEVNTRSKTPSQRANVEGLSDLRKPTRTPGDIADTQKEPAGGAKSTKEFKEAPEQKLDSSENVTGSRRRSRTPRRKAQPIEDLAGFRELFQTPSHIVETVSRDKTTKTPCKSPQPEPVSTPTSMTRRLRTPVGKMDVEEELSALRKPTPRPGETTRSCRAPIKDDKDIKAVKETPKQKLDSAGNIIGSRRSRTPIGKVQPMEDLVGFRELFQTPDHTMESLTEDKTSKTPSKSPRPEPLSTPTSTKTRFRTPVGKVDTEDESAEFFKETPEQKLDSAKYATGSRRRLRTPRRKVQPIEDLAGFKELFQTPNHIIGTVTDDKITKTSCKSPKSEPVSTPTSSKRRSRTPLGKVDMEDELSALRKATPRPGETTHAHREPEGDDKSSEFFMETPKQELDSVENESRRSRRSRTPKRKVQPMEDLVGFKELFQTPNHIIEIVTDDKTTKIPCKSPKSELISTPTSTKRRSRKVDSAENVIGSRRRSRTPRRKVQPIEDLAGFKELFQTPDHILGTVTDDKTKTPCNSPQPEPVSTPTSSKRRSRTPLGKVDMEDELSALRKATPRPGETTHAHREPEGDDKGITAFKETPQQKPDSAENVTGSRRRSRTPRRKVQPMEDLAGFRELFQTPSHIVETVTHDKTKTPCKSPQPEPVSTPTSLTRRLRTPVGKMDVEEELSALRKPTPGESTHSHREPEGDDKGITAFKETPGQKPDSAENVTGSRRRSRTPRRKAQPIEDLAGFRELFQTPDHILGTVTDDKTKTPCNSPQPEPVSTPTSSKRRCRTSLGKVDVQEALSALRKATPRPGETTHLHRKLEGDDKSTELLMETPKHELDAVENVTRSRRRSKTPKRKVQPMEDLAGFKELFQTPNHIIETVTDDKTTEIPCKSPKSELISTPTSTKRRSRTPLGKVDMEDELSALRKATPRPGETTHSHREPEGDDKGITAFKETPQQKPDLAENVIGSRRRSRTPRRKVQPMEDLAGFKELFQTPSHILGTVTDDKTKTPCNSPQPEPVSTPTSSKRRSRTPLGKVDMEDELSALRKATPRPGGSTHSHREPEGDDKGITAFKETPQQKKPDSAENVTGSRRRSRTPRRKAQPIEDLAGFRELFQTPSHIVETVSRDKTTKTPGKSPQPEPVSTPTSMTRRLRTPVGKMDVEEELSALRKPTPGESTHSHREPEGDDKGITAFKETPGQKPDSAENVTGSRRRSRTPRRKVQPIEDLAGFKELFQTPDHIMESSADDKTTKIPCKSQNPEPVIMLTGRNRRVKAPQGKVVVEDEFPALRRPTRTLGRTTRPHRAPEAAGEDTNVLGEIPEEKSDPAENVTGSKRRPRTRKEKAEPMEDLTGLKDEPETLVQTTEVPSEAPQPEAAVPARRKRQVRAPPRKADMEEGLSAPRKPTRTSARATRSHRAPEAADEDAKLLEEIPEEKSDPAENATGSRRRPRARKEKAQPLEDLAGRQEPLHTSCHTEEPETLVQTTEVPSEAPQPEAVLPARRKRQVRAPPRKADEEEGLSAPKKPTRTSARATRSHRAPEAADEDAKVLKEIPEEKSDPAENATGNRRRPRARKEKAQPLEDLAGLKDEPETLVQTAEVPSEAPQPEAAVPEAAVPARRKRPLRAPPRKVDVEEELSAAQTSGRTTRARREPADVTVSKESPRQALGPAADTAGSKRQPRSRKGRAQPPEGPARRQPLPPSPVRDEEPDAGTENKPARPRRVLWAPDVKPVEGQAGRRDPVTPPGGASVPLAPKRKREDGSPARTRGLRTSARAQDPVEEKPAPKRQRTAPQERREPPEPLGPKRRRGAVADSTEDVPGEDLGTKTRGGRALVAASAGKEVSLRSRLPAKTSSAEHTPGAPEPAGAGKTKRSGRKSAPASPEAKSHSPEGGAGSAAPGDAVRERRACPRPGSRGRAAGETREEAPGETREETEGARPAGLTQRRARKVTVPPAGDTAERQPKPRATRSARRPVGEARQEDDDTGVKKMRTRSHRGREDA